jgi:hypothetical protein
MEASIDIDIDHLRGVLDLPDEFLTEENVKGLIEQWVDDSELSTLNNDDVERIIQREVPHYVPEGLDQDDVERITENLLASRELMTGDTATDWVISQANSMPADPSTRCRLGKAFTDAVLKVVADVVDQASEPGTALFNRLALNLACHAIVEAPLVVEGGGSAAPMPEPGYVGVPLLPWVRDTTWSATDEEITQTMDVLRSVLAARGVAKPVQYALMLNHENDRLGNKKVLGPFGTWDEAQAYAERTRRHGAHIVIEYPEA